GSLIRASRFSLLDFFSNSPITGTANAAQIKKVARCRVEILQPAQILAAVVGLNAKALRALPHQLLGRAGSLQIVANGFFPRFRADLWKFLQETAHNHTTSLAFRVFYDFDEKPERAVCS